MVVGTLPDPVTKELASTSVKVAAFGLRKASEWYRGFDILILGQERSGKSTLYNFLRLRLLGQDGVDTDPTVVDVNSGVFSFEWQTDAGPLSLAFRNVGDRSGQIGPHRHAEMLVNKKPHLVIIVLDISSPEVADQLNASYIQWFRYFCTYINNLLINKERKARKVNSKLRSILVILNKIDKLDPGTATNKIDNAKENIRNIMNQHLSGRFGYRVNYFPILPCVMVENPRHGTGDETIRTLKDLVRRLVEGTARVIAHPADFGMANFRLA
jgi:GTPase SAR1 family protein